MIKSGLFLLFCFPYILLAQKNINASFQQAPLEAVIHQLEADYGVVFSYTEDLIQNNHINAVIVNQDLETALGLVFRATNIDFEIVDEHYVVLRKKEIPVIQVCGQIIGGDGPLPFANILSKKSMEGQSTNEDGRFHLRNRIFTDDTIVISYVGYETLLLPANKLKDCPVIQLEARAFSFTEVLVKEYVTEGIEQAIELDHIVLKPDKISVVPGLTEADVLQMVQILPGVQSVDESATGIHIRGGTPDQNLIRWDGIPIYNGGHFFGMISAFNPYIVDEVKVYRSGFDAKFGGRTSGLVDIQSIQEVPLDIEADAGLNFTHADAAITLPLRNKKSAVSISARRSYTDIVESPTYQRLSQRVFQKEKFNELEEGEIEIIETELQFKFNDLNAKWLWKPDNNNEVALSFFRIEDRLDFVFEDFVDSLRTTDRLDLINLGWSANWKKKWSRKFESDFLMTHTNLENERQSTRMVFGNNSLETEQENQVVDFTVRWDNTWTLSNNLKLDFGYQMTDLEVERSWELEDKDSDEDQETEQLHSTYVSLISKFKNKLRYNAGIRWTYSIATQKSILEPRITVQYLPNEKWQFKTSAGLYNQFIGQVIELNDLGLNQQLWALSGGADNLPVSRSEQYTLGLIYHTSDLQIEVESYYKKLQGLTSLSPAFYNASTGDSPYPEGTGTAWGVDLLLKKKWSQYQSWLAYSYGRVFYTFDSFNESEKFAAPHDRPHSLTFMNQYEYKRWNFALSWKLASGRVYTSADEFLADATGAYPVYNYNETNKNRLSIFHRLDLSVLYEILPKRKKMEGLIGVSFLNLYNRKNTLSREFLVFEKENLPNEYELKSIDRTMLRFTPNIVFRINWK